MYNTFHIFYKSTNRGWIFWWHISDYHKIKLKIIAEVYTTICLQFNYWKEGGGCNHMLDCCFLKVVRVKSNNGKISTEHTSRCQIYTLIIRFAVQQNKDSISPLVAYAPMCLCHDWHERWRHDVAAESVIIMFLMLLWLSYVYIRK
jgi:hypothetical protein